MIRAVVLMLVVSATSLAAQQHPLVGEWAVSYTAGMRIENGEATPLKATGLLSVTARGDSLIGTLTMHPMGDMPPRPPARLAAMATEGAVTLVSTTTATLNMDGEVREATAVSTWVLTARGDSLEGTVERRIEGLEAGVQPPSAVTGTRKRG